MGTSGYVGAWAPYPFHLYPSGRRFRLKPPPRVALVGLRAAGKSAVGRALAERWGVPSLDSDRAISESTGRTPAEWLRDEGEARFREVESAVVVRLATESSGVLALGGGALTKPESVAALREWTTLWLDADDQELYRRMQDDRPRPPLTDHEPEDEIRALRSERETRYAAVASYRWDTTGRTIEEIVDAIVEELQRRESE